LIKAVGAPVALLVDAAMLVVSVLVLRGIRVAEVLQRSSRAAFLPELKAGVRFVRSTPLLVAMAATVGLWQMCHHAAVVVQILFATRTLALNEQDVGLAFVGLGLGTVLASVFGRRISARIGPGPSLLAGIGSSGAGWLLFSAVPPGPWALFAFGAMLFAFGFGAVMIFVNFLALRQAVTPAPLLGRMTSTMRWLILLPAGPGALIGGWLGEHVDLRASLAFAGLGALLVAALAWRHRLIRGVRALPQLPDERSAPGAEAEVRPLVT
jgi:predicted MFS family arabinose efflux permease